MAALVSLIYPCLNEEKNLPRLLAALERQTYPHRDIEVIIADANSTDRTLELIDAWNVDHDIKVRIVTNERRIAEFGAALALKEAKGDYLYVQGCDHEMAQDDGLETCMNAFSVFPDIVGVAQYFLKIPGGSQINNYLAISQIPDPLARDMVEWPKLLEKRVVDGRAYRKLEFPPSYPALLLYKREIIQEFIGQETFEEGQVMLNLALRGKNRMCMVDGYGVRHYYVTSLSQFIRKRAKIALKHTTRIQERKTWVSYTGNRLYIFAFLHLTLVYPVLYSIVKAVRSRDLLWLYHGPMCFITSFVYLVNWIRLKVTRKKAW